jgi:hypothetical protein
MNWKEKFRFVSQYLEANDDIDQDFYIKEAGANSETLSVLSTKYPFISEEYIEFIRVTDGADIAQCRLYGSSEYAHGEEMYSGEYKNNEWFPFGHEAGGDPLLLEHSGKVAIGTGKSVSGEFEYIANNFSEFLSEILMGTNYPSIFRIGKENYSEFIQRELESGDDPWLNFLVKQKWLYI